MPVPFASHSFISSLLVPPSLFCPQNAENSSRKTALQDAISIARAWQPCQSLGCRKSGTNRRRSTWSVPRDRLTVQSADSRNLPLYAGPQVLEPAPKRLDLGIEVLELGSRAEVAGCVAVVEV